MDAAFTPEVLDSYPRFCKYFEGNSAIEQILREARSTTIKRNPLDARQIQILSWSKPLAKIYIAFADAMEKLLFVVGFTSWSIQIGVHKRLWEHDRRLEAWGLFGQDCFSTTINSAAQESSDIYLQPTQPVQVVASDKVRRVIEPRIKELVFNHERGCCRGISEWFFYLYFKTQKFFKNREDHLRAVTQVFKNGAPSQALLLQVLQPLDTECLRLKVNDLKIVDANHPISKIFQKLKPGAYAVGLPGQHDHRVNYIAVSSKKGYLFDPRFGTIAIRGSEGFEKLAFWLRTYGPKCFVFEKLSMSPVESP